MKRAAAIPQTPVIERRTEAVTAEAQALLEIVVGTDASAGESAMWQQTLQSAQEFLTGVIRPLRTEIDATFDPIIAKAHAAHREAVQQKKRIEGPLVLIEQQIKTALLRRYEELLAQQKRVVEENTRIAVQAGFDADGQPVPVPRLPIPIVPKVTGVAFQQRLTFDVLNPLDIAAAYLEPNLEAIRKAVATFGKGAEKIVGGIRVYEKSAVVIRETKEKRT